MSDKEKLQVIKNDNTIVNADIFLPENLNNIFPLIIFSHGFNGFKDWGGFPYMMDRVANAGFIGVSFNFTFNGVDNNHPSEFSRLDLFAKNTFSRELDDLQVVLNYFYENAEKYNIDNSRIGLLGHSRGGGISILKAYEDFHVKALTALASVCTFDRYSDEHKKNWKEKGYFEVTNSRTKQVMRMDSALLEDLENNSARLDIINAMKNMHKPALLIHGKEDLSVRFEEAEKLYNASDKNSTELFTVPNTGHTFGTVEPFEGTTSAFEKVIDRLIGFFKKNL
jgi:dipeptidyl aminopeptidase/acylaminoacyl peptidase